MVTWQSKLVWSTALSFVVFGAVVFAFLWAPVVDGMVDYIVGLGK